MTDMFVKFLPWLDLFWLPLTLAIVHPEQRIKSMVFVAACVFMLRLQVEMMGQLGFQDGFFRWWEWPILYRGMAGYGVFIAFYLLTARLSPRSDIFVLMAAGITIFITAFCVTSALMVL